MKTMATLIVSILAAASANAAVQAMLFQVTPDSGYTVPTGKVLIIDHTTTGEVFQDSSATFWLTNGPSNLYVSVGEPAPPATSSALPVPVNIPGGWTIGIGPDSPGTNWVFGRLVDTTDLFAGIQSQIKDVAKQGSSLAMQIQTSSPRAAKVAVEKSNPLGQNWQPATEAVVVPTENKTKYMATVPIDQDEESFRAKVTVVK